MAAVPSWALMRLTYLFGADRFTWCMDRGVVGFVDILWETIVERPPQR